MSDKYIYIIFERTVENIPVFDQILIDYPEIQDEKRDIEILYAKKDLEVDAQGDPILIDMGTYFEYQLQAGKNPYGLMKLVKVGYESVKDQYSQYTYTETEYVNRSTITSNYVRSIIPKI
jgi:hypothetical protein